MDAELENTTCYVAETVRIKCDITGYPLPKYRWYKDGDIIKVRRTDDRLSIKTTAWGSRLADFSNLLFSTNYRGTCIVYLA